MLKCGLVFCCVGKLFGLLCLCLLILGVYVNWFTLCVVDCCCLLLTLFCFDLVFGCFVWVLGFAVVVVSC